jgi:hypothetical protein
MAENTKKVTVGANEQPRVVERVDVSQPGRTIRVKKLIISAQQVSSVNAAMLAGKASRSK